MSPQNWLCRSERNSALDTQVPISPLVYINGDNAYSPQIPDTKLTVTSQVQFLQLQHVFRQKCKNTIPHTSDNTRCFHNISWRHFVSILTSLNSTSLAAPKANPIFHAANKKKTFFVVLLKKSFVIHLCCLKNIVLEKLTISRNAIKLNQQNNMGVRITQNGVREQTTTQITLKPNKN